MLQQQKDFTTFSFPSVIRLINFPYKPNDIEIVEELIV
jgi:hypothetical protein